MSYITPQHFITQSLALKSLLAQPLEATPAELYRELDSFQRTLSDFSVRSLRIDSMLLYVEAVSWGADICHQVCDGIRTLLQMEGLQPKPSEPVEDAYVRFLATVNGRAREYETTQCLSNRDLAVVDRVVEKSSGQEAVRKTFDNRSSFGLALSGFFNEARFSMRMGPRSAPKVLDCGMTGEGKPFLVFESMTGDLRSVFDAQKPRDVYQEAIKLSSLLLYLNLHGIVHRDIKPSNILVDVSGNYLLTDFALAVFQDEIPLLPSFCYLNGTPAYLPPESRSAKQDFVPGYAQDIYALGMTLLETVTGRFLPRNFSGKSNVSKILGIRDEGWMRFFRRSLEKDGNAQWQLERLAAIVNKATAPDPLQRYSYGAEMFLDIHHTLRPGSIPVGPILAESLRDAFRQPNAHERDTVLARPRITNETLSK